MPRIDHKNGYVNWLFLFYNIDQGEYHFPKRISLCF